jgi:DNA-binding PadR family transcriptional regulator
MIPQPEGLNFLEENRNGKQCEMDNSSVSDDIRHIVDGVRKVITKSLANSPFQSSKPSAKPDLEIAVLAALSQGAKNGAGVVSQIRLASAGTYSPTQAEVQLTLERFIEKRWAKIVVVEDLRLYDLTKAGTAEFESRELTEPETTPNHEHTSECAKCSQSNWAPHAGVLAAGAKLAQTVVEASAANHANKHQAAVALLEETRRKLQEILAEKP